MTGHEACDWSLGIASVDRIGRVALVPTSGSCLASPSHEIFCHIV